MQVPLIDFDQSSYMDVPVDGEHSDVIAYPRELEEFDEIIYLPTMKTHFLAGFSMSLKLAVGLTHLFDRFLLHADSNMFVCERATEMSIPIKPDLIIMDGRVPSSAEDQASDWPSIRGSSWHPATRLPWTYRASVCSRTTRRSII